MKHHIFCKNYPKITIVFLTTFFTISVLVAPLSYAEDLFNSHHKMMVRALHKGNEERVLALLKTPYILESNYQEYAVLATHMRKFKLLEKFIIDLKLDIEVMNPTNAKTWRIINTYSTYLTSYYIQNDDKTVLPVLRYVLENSIDTSSAIMQINGTCGWHAKSKKYGERYNRILNVINWTSKICKDDKNKCKYPKFKRLNNAGHTAIGKTSNRKEFEDFLIWQKKVSEYHCPVLLEKITNKEL